MLLTITPELVQSSSDLEKDIKIRFRVKFCGEMKGTRYTNLIGFLV